VSGLFVQVQYYKFNVFVLHDIRDAKRSIDSAHDMMLKSDVYDQDLACKVSGE
jgi:hypothetical protein